MRRVRRAHAVPRPAGETVTPGVHDRRSGGSMTRKYGKVTPLEPMFGGFKRDPLPFDSPLNPPREWFDRPDWLERGETFVVTDDGRVGGRLHERITSTLGPDTRL